jgi:hypothetical protein
MYQVRTTGINSFDSGIHEHELDEHDEHEHEHEHEHDDELDEHDDHVQNRFSLDHMPTAALITIVNNNVVKHPELKSFAERFNAFPKHHATKDGTMIVERSKEYSKWNKEVLGALRPLGLVAPKAQRAPRAPRAAPAPPVHHNPSNDMKLNVGGHVVTIKNAAHNTTVVVSGAVSSAAPNTPAAGKARKNSEYHRLRKYLNTHNFPDTHDMLNNAHTKCYGNGAGTAGDNNIPAFHEEVTRLAHTIPGFKPV